jgi:hypothetical protein
VLLSVEPWVFPCANKHIHEESCQEYVDDEDLDETSISILLLDEGEVIHTCFPPTHQDKKIFGFNDTNDLVEDPFDVVDQHIDDFIHVERHRWDVVCFNFDKIPFTMLKVVLKKKGLSFHLHRMGLHAYMIQMLGILVMK